MGSAQEAAARFRSLVDCGPDVGRVQCHQLDGRNEVVVGGVRQSIAQEAYARIGMFESCDRVSRIWRLLTELNFSSYVDNAAASRQKIGAELQQLVSAPLG